MATVDTNPTTSSVLDIPGVDPLGSEVVAQDYGKWLIHGPQGFGKTTLAGTIGELGPTLFIDLVGEKGVRVLKGSTYYGNFTFVRPDSVTALDDIFWFLNGGQHDFVAVVVDSTTALQKMTSRFLQGHDETAVREIKRGASSKSSWELWGQSLDIMTDHATFWYGLADVTREKPIHVVMTAQTKIEESEDTGEVVRNVDVQKGAKSIMLAAPDYILYVDMEDHPEHMSDPEKYPAYRHIVRFGADPRYRTKARIPRDKWGKIPSVLGRKTPLSLVTLSRLLDIGGIPPAKTKKEK